LFGEEPGRLRGRVAFCVQLTGCLARRTLGSRAVGSGRGLLELGSSALLDRSVQGLQIARSGSGGLGSRRLLTGKQPGGRLSGRLRGASRGDSVAQLHLLDELSLRLAGLLSTQCQIKASAIPRHRGGSLRLLGHRRRGPHGVGMTLVGRQVDDRSLWTDLTARDEGG